MAEASKITFTSYSDEDCTKSLGVSIAAVINPESFQLSETANFTSTKEMGANKETKVFEGGNQSLSLQNLIVDGTGIVPMAQAYKDVDSYLTALKSVVIKYEGTQHTKVFVKITWGNCLNFKGVCTSLNIKYTLFTPDGKALRASVDMQFSGTASMKTKTAEENKSSPDLTHMRTVKAGDTLPLMAYRIYGDSSYYMFVAKENKLNNVSAIKPGDQLRFPPLPK